MTISRILGSLALAGSLTLSAVASTTPTTALHQNKPATTAKHTVAKHTKKHAKHVHRAAKTATAAPAAK